MTAPAEYVFSPEWTQERNRLRSLEALFDEASTRHLAGLGAGEGWRCLEVGCGAGGVACWLAERVGPAGGVVATDLDTRFIDTGGRANLEVRRHDIRTDPLEEGAFDLVHARALLEHLPEHRQVLQRMVAALRPGGWVVVEDTDFGDAMASALSRYSHPATSAALTERIYRAVDAIFERAGADAAFGPRLVGELQAAGLEQVGGSVHSQVVAGGSEHWVRGSLAQLSGRISGAGLATEEEIHRFLTLAGDESTRYATPFMVTAWGRRPGG